MTKFYKPSEVAKQLRVSAETIRNLCRSGKMPHLRIGDERGSIRIAEDALQAWLNRSAGKPSQTPELPTTHYSNLPGLNY